MCVYMYRYIERERFLNKSMQIQMIFRRGQMEVVSKGLVSFCSFGWYDCIMDDVPNPRLANTRPCGNTFETCIMVRPWYGTHAAKPCCQQPYVKA